MHIGIAGAGLLGRLLAFELASAGHSVEVFDPASGPQAPAAGTAPYAAGWTAAGMLSPTAELESADAHVSELGLRSLALWPAIVAALGLPVELHGRGSLLLAHRGDEGAARRVVNLLRHKALADHAPQLLDAAALAQGASAAGARWHWGLRVSRLQADQVAGFQPKLVFIGGANRIQEERSTIAVQVR